MLQIGNTLVSLDLVERFFQCDLDDCLGECCIEGDAGAPLTEEEAGRLEKLWPRLKEELSPAALRVIEEQGTSYRDSDGDLVTSIVDGRDCVFTCYAPGGYCLCALEKMRRKELAEGHASSEFFKPVSCSLYPVRIRDYDGFSAVNLHRWKICKGAEVLGRKNGVRAYQFLKEPLTRRFGEDWYRELELTAAEWLRQKNKD